MASQRVTQWGMVGLIPIAVLVVALPDDLRTLAIVAGAALYPALLWQVLCQAPPRRTLSDDRTRAR